MLHPCNTSGDVLDLLVRLDGGSPYDVARELLNRPLIQTPVLPVVPAPSRFQPFTRTLELEHRLPFLLGKGIEPATARQFEVGSPSHSRWLAGCVAVRLHDPQGRPWGYAGRVLAPSADQPKWRFPPGLPKGSLLYGFHHLALPLEELTLVECPWGVLRLHQLGIPAVALLGVHLTEAQRRLLSPVRRLVLLLDGDPAGRLAQTRLKKRLSLEHEVESIGLPEGRDPDDLSDPELCQLLGRNRP